MTPTSTREATVRRVSRGVVASYLHEISTRGASPRPGDAAPAAPRPPQRLAL